MVPAPTLVRRLAAAFVVVLLSTLGVPAAAHASAPDGADWPPPLPLGSSGLSEQRSSDQLAPGVTYTHIVRGYRSDEAFSVESRLFDNATQAHGYREELTDAGYAARVLEISDRAQDDPGSGPYLWVVRVGLFDTRDAAKAEQTRMGADGFTRGRIVYTGEDGGATTGPWDVHILRIDAKEFHGVVHSALATDVVPGRERVSSMVARKRAVAGVNGGYFVIPSRVGTPGDLMGVSAVGGDLVSEALNGRPALLLQRQVDDADIAEVTTALHARSRGASILVDGRNRPNGLVDGCGGVGGDVPTQRPLQNVLCTDPDEVIQYTPDYGSTSPDQEGIEAVLGPHGSVLKVRQPAGGPIPPDGSTLVATGTATEWVRQHAQPGARVTVDVDVVADGKRVPLRTTDIINGSPELVQDGKLRITAYEDGHVLPDNPSVYWRFGIRRAPRTLAGITADRDLLLVTVDGRPDPPEQPSVGLSVKEAAKLMQTLGAEEAVNLDGGGSSTMVGAGRVLNTPSDAAGERPVADSVLVLPKSTGRSDR